MRFVRTLPEPIRTPVIRSLVGVVRSLRSANWPQTNERHKLECGPLVVSGFINEALGIGRAAHMTADALDRAGLHPILHSIRPALEHYPRGGLMLPSTPMEKGFANGGVWIIQANAPECDILLQALDPDTWKSRYRIGYWVWETTEAPSSWARTAKWFHEIWTPSQYSANALSAGFQRAGLGKETSKIRIVPHPAPRLNSQAKRNSFHLPQSAFIALTTFDGRSSLARKNPYAAVETWISTQRTPSPNRILIVKSIESTADRKGVAEIKAAAQGRPDIHFLDQRLGNREMGNLLASADLVISLHRSEGFGLMLAEAMSLGKIILSSNNSAPREYLNKNNAVLVDTVDCPVSDRFGTYKTGEWSDPILTDATLKLSLILDEPENYTKLGKQAQIDVTKFDLPWTAAKLNEAEWKRHILSG
jgi:glycosyltransferase involved in cell wall biosynthesis